MSDVSRLGPLVTWLLGVSYLACGPESVTIGVPPGFDVLVIGSLGSATEKPWARATTSAGDALAVSTADETSLFGFGLARSDFSVGGLREPEDAELRGVGAIGRDEDECGRCRFPTPSAPMVVFPGDRCTLPGFAAVLRLRGDRLEPLTQPQEAAEALRRSLRLSWPGACLPPADGLPVATATHFRLLAQAPEGSPLERFAELPDGSIGLFSFDSASLRAPLGEVSDWPGESSGSIKNALAFSDPPDAPFVLTMRSDSNSRSKVRYERLRPGVPPERVLTQLEEMLHHGALALRWVPRSLSGSLGLAPPRGSVLALGQSPFGRNVLVLCPLSGDLGCLDMGNEALGFPGTRGAADAVVSQSGELIVAFEGSLHRRDPTTGRWTALMSDADASFQRLFTLGSRILACGEGGAEGYAMIFSGTSTAALTRVYSGPPKGECGEIFEGPARRGIWVRFADLTVDLGPPLRLVSWPSLSARALKSDVPGSVLVQDTLLTLWRDRGEGLEQLIGLGPLPPQSTAGVAAGQAVLALADGGQSFEVSPEGEQLTLSPVRPSGLPVGVEATGMAPMADGWIVSGYDRARLVGSLHFVSTSSTFRIFETRGERIVSVAQLDPETHVAVADDYGIWLQHGSGDPERVTVEWLTGAPPEESGRTCPEKFFAFGPKSATFRHVAAAGGVAWAVGCEGAVVRIAGRRAIQVGIDFDERNVGDDRGQPKLTNVLMLAPDRALLAGQGDESQTEEQGRLFVGTAGPDGATVSDLLELHAAPREKSGSTSGYPIDLVSTRHGAVIAFDGGAVSLAFGQTVFRYPASLASAVVAPSGELVLFTRFGQVVSLSADP